MKYIRAFLCAAMICFLVLTPKRLVAGAQVPFEDKRFTRPTDRYTGSIVLYHIVRHRPYTGSLTQWLKNRAEAYEKKHKGTYIEIEGMEEASFYERLEHGRKADAYSFFSGSLDEDRLGGMEDLKTPVRDGLFQTNRCAPYCYSGYLRMKKTPDSTGEKTYFANAVLAARLNAAGTDAPENKADTLYLDFRRAGDLIRYKPEFALAETEPIDSFTDAVCWMGIDRDVDERKAGVILDFIGFLLEPDQQKTLNALGLLSVRADVRDVPPEARLKRIFKTYATVSTVDPFLWRRMYDALSEDAELSKKGDSDANERFAIRLRECLR